MSRINAKVIDFVMNAYGALCDVPEEWHHRAAWHDYDFNNPQWLRFAMFRTHTHYGEWALFDGGSYVASFDTAYLKGLWEAELERREAYSAKAKDAAVVVS